MTTTTTNANLPAAFYCRLAASRLAEAEAKYARATGLPYPDDILELAKTASLVWDAVMDILSALQTQDGREPSGRSSDMRQYARHHLPAAIYDHWSPLALLHNFQHKPTQPIGKFREVLWYSGVMLQLLNACLPTAVQLPSDCFRWMLTASPDRATAATDP